MTKKNFFFSLAFVFLVTIGFFIPKPPLLPLKIPLAKLPVSPKLAPPPIIKLVFVGDVSLARMVNLRIVQKGFEYPFLKTAAFLGKADLSFSNLESPLVSNCPPMSTGMKFCGRPENVQSLVFAGIDLVSVANNHIFNYGQAGFEETIEILLRAGIKPVGFDNKPIFSIGNTKIAFLAYDATSKLPSAPTLAAETSQAKTQADLVIVSFHWGLEYTDQPIPYQKQLAHLAIDNGADLIIGHHPHWIQTEEIYQGRHIFYSLGNFVFDQMWSEKTRRGLVVTAAIKDKKLIKIEKQEVYIEDYCQPQLILVE